MAGQNPHKMTLSLCQGVFDWKLNQQSIQLASSHQYHGNTVVMYQLTVCVCSNERPLDAQMRYFGEVLLNRPGFGTRCMAEEPLQ